MARLLLAVRMLVGLSMVAGGVVLVTPLASRLVAASARARGDAPDPGADPGAVAVVSPPGPPAVVAQPVAEPWGGASVGVPAAVAQPACAPSAADEALAAMTMPPAGHTPPLGAPVGGPIAAEPRLPEPPPLDRDYRPPPPPPALGSAAQEFSLPQPGMPDLYRAAHGAPPPPLLDGARPEPGRTTEVGGSSAGPPSPWPTPALDIPRSTYRVRDGDDLVGIAARLYGHPAAAHAVWEANRDRLADPGLLPIGLELRLPAPWEIDLHPTTSAAAIEPRRSAASATTWSGAERPADTAAPWLGNAGPPAAPAAWPGPRPAAPPAGSRVVVAPGETLVSLATRLYGDPHAARRIWEANRDRLRSPELLVPGMELRLP